MMRIELYKIARKKEFIVLMCMLAFPVVFCLLFLSGSVKSGDVSTGPLGILGFTAVTFGFFEQLGALGLIVGILTVSTLSSEIDNHNILLYFPRISSRKRLYSNKASALTFTFTIWFLLFLLVSVLSYLLLTFLNNAEVSGLIFDSFSPGFALALLATYVYLLFIMNFTLFIGSYLKPLVSILYLLGIIYGSMLLQGVPVIGYLFPLHYMQLAMQDLGSQTNLLPVFSNYTISIGLCLVYIVAFHFLGRRRIVRLEV